MHLQDGLLTSSQTKKKKNFVQKEKKCLGFCSLDRNMILPENVKRTTSYTQMTDNNNNVMDSSQHRSGYTD